MNILLYTHKIKQEDYTTIHSLVATLKTQRVKLFTYQGSLGELEASPNIFTDLEVIDSHESLKQAGIELTLTLGGDGTILRATSIVRELGIPILGLNLGRLGFLASIEKSRITETVHIITNKQYMVEQRVMLALESNLPIFTEAPFALNDFTIHKRDTSSMVTIHAYLDDVFLNTYWADGLIVATPTGSTGYSLACGGPIIFPGSGNWAITPIAPHNLNVRPLIVSDDSKIKLMIEGRTENFLASLDYRHEVITDEHEIVLKKCGFKTMLALPNDVSFLGTIRDKLMWGLDKRN